MVGVMPLRFSPERLRQARLDAGMTPELLAGLAGISRTSVTNAENRVIREPRPLYAKAMAEALGIDVSALYDEVDEEDMAS